MKGKRKVVSELLWTSGFLRLVSSMGSNRLSVLNYHRIRSVGNACAFDDDVHGPTVDEFRVQMKWLANNANPLSEADLIEIRHGRKALERRSVVVTFDDGYSDNYWHALPILEEFGIPAIYFIPTDHIDGRKVGWWDEIAYLVKNTRKSEIVVEGKAYAIDGSGDSSARLPVIRALQHRMQRRPAFETSNLLDSLSTACEVERASQSLMDGELMSWAQIRDSSARGITIGSHTRTHRVLATLSLDEQREELRVSKGILEERIGKPVRSFAYPVGGYEHFNSETPALVGESGYDLAFSFQTGPNPVGTIDPYNIRRSGVNPCFSTFRSEVLWPWAFSRRGCELSAPRPAVPNYRVIPHFVTQTVSG